MVPAALAGYDVAAILDRGTRRACKRIHARRRSRDSPAVRFGAAIASLARAGRDKLTIVTHPEVVRVRRVGRAVDRRIDRQERHGNHPDRGRDARPAARVRSRSRLRLRRRGPTGRTNTFRARWTPARSKRGLEMLEDAGHPVIRLAMTDRFDIGEQFALWEIATAAAGSVLGIDAFDQPNVQESKDNTKRLLDDYKTNRPLHRTAGRRRTTTSRASSRFPVRRTSRSATISAARCRRCLRRCAHGDYVAFHGVHRTQCRTRASFARHPADRSQCAARRNDGRLRPALLALDGAVAQRRSRTAACSCN